MLRNLSLSIAAFLAVQLLELYNALECGERSGCATDFVIRGDRIADVLLKWNWKSLERVFVVEPEHLRSGSLLWRLKPPNS